MTGPARAHRRWHAVSAGSRGRRCERAADGHGANGCVLCLRAAGGGLRAAGCWRSGRDSQHGARSTETSPPGRRSASSMYMASSITQSRERIAVQIAAGTASPPWPAQRFKACTAASSDGRLGPAQGRCIGPSPMQGRCVAATHAYSAPHLPTARLSPSPSLCPSLFSSPRPSPHPALSPPSLLFPPPSRSLPRPPLLLHLLPAPLLWTSLPA